MRDDNCIFCKIANGDIPSKALYEDDDFKVILDLGPATKGHALILPKNHYANLYKLPDEAASKVMLLAKKMTIRMTEKLNCGQTVFHFHLHLIPRYKNDGQTLGWKSMEPTPEELEDIRKIITE